MSPPVIDRNCWLTWKHLDGRKPPVGNDGRPLKDWQAALLTREEAEQRREMAQADGIGVALEAAGLSGLDIDDCRDPDGKIDPRALGALDAVQGAYVEISPSGKGLKAMFTGDGSWLELNFRVPDHVTVVRKSGGYFTVTGDVYGPPGSMSFQPPLGTLEALEMSFSASGRSAPAGKAALPTDGGAVLPGRQDNWLAARAWQHASRGMQFEDVVAQLRIDVMRCPQEPGREPWTDSDFRRLARGACDKMSLREADILTLGDWMDIGRRFVAAYAGGYLAYWGGVFYRYDPELNTWIPAEESEVRGEIWEFLEASRVRVRQKEGGEWTTQPIRPARKHVVEVLDATRAVTFRASRYPSPAWLDGREDSRLVAVRNGLLRLSDRALLAASPDYFNLIALPFDYKPGAKLAPDAKFFAFLQSLWPEDPESIATLQEIFGYIVAGETSYQKILMLVGPKRGGKGTIARLLRALVGPRNTCGPTLLSLGETFGREPLIGKSLAIIADARLGGRANIAAVVEELLAISGEDNRSIPRKYLPAWDGEMPVRFLVLSNELPRLEDASGALASRFVLLRLTQSFYGREDHQLFSHLSLELPGILNWALDGWDRLVVRGNFAEPRSVMEIREQFEALGSPITAFLRDHAQIGPNLRASKEDTWRRWRAWCESTGRTYSGTDSTLARDLRAALPALKTVRIMGADGKRSHIWIGFELIQNDELPDF